MIAPSALVSVFHKLTVAFIAFMALLSKTGEVIFLYLSALGQCTLLCEFSRFYDKHCPKLFHPGLTSDYHL